MRKLIKLIKLNIATIVVAIFSIVFYSCNDDSEEVERFKEEYRDPNLFGKWKLLRNVPGDYYAIIFTKSGEWKSTSEPSTDENSAQFDYYYYTQDNKLYYLYPNDPLKGGGESGYHEYRIENDTLAIRYLRSGSAPKISKYVKIKE